MATTDIERGLSTGEVEQRIAAGKINRNMELKTKSVRELIIENLCTLFNLINVVLAVLVLLTGSFKNLTFLFVVFLNTAIGVIQSMRSKRMVDKLTLLTSKKAIAVRDGAEVELDLDQIVLDDIIRLGRGDQIPADAVVVSGEALVNEPADGRERSHQKAAWLRAHEWQLYRLGPAARPCDPCRRRQLRGQD